VWFGSILFQRCNVRLLCVAQKWSYRRLKYKWHRECLVHQFQWHKLAGSAGTVWNRNTGIYGNPQITVACERWLQVHPKRWFSADFRRRWSGSRDHQTNSDAEMAQEIREAIGSNHSWQPGWKGIWIGQSSVFFHEDSWANFNWSIDNIGNFTLQRNVGVKSTRTVWNCATEWRWFWDSVERSRTVPSIPRFSRNCCVCSIFLSRAAGQIKIHNRLAKKSRRPRAKKLYILGVWRGILRRGIRLSSKTNKKAVYRSSMQKVLLAFLPIQNSRHNSRAFEKTIK
jgi:hypothetical protein